MAFPCLLNDLVITSGKAWVDEDNVIRFFKQWNPHENDTQFKEVLERLTNPQIEDLVNKLCDEIPEFDYNETGNIKNK